MRTEDKAGQGDVLGENERDHMPDVHAITTGSSAGIQIERLSLLIPIQDSVKLPTQKQTEE